MKTMVVKGRLISRSSPLMSHSSMLRAASQQPVSASLGLHAVPVGRFFLPKARDREGRLPDEMVFGVILAGHFGGIRQRLMARSCGGP
jgi:hypothetical protein